LTRAAHLGLGLGLGLDYIAALIAMAIVGR
jgi:hypothetical protein